MSFKAVITDLDGRNRAFVAEWQRLVLTPRLSGFAEVALDLRPLDAAVGELFVAKRALKVYEDASLRFFGKVWEPLGVGSESVRVVARDPYAEFAQRRVRAVTTYTAQDAGAIAQDRVTVQNGFRNTYLRNGTRDTSVNRDRTYNPGTLEGESVQKLTEAENGFFFRVAPVDDVVGVMGDFVIEYPDAGTTREEVRFEYGEDTLANVDGYDLTYVLPRNRMTVASSASTGGRISGVAEDADSIAEYGLFEDETTFSDATAVALLQQHAKAEIRPSPPLIAVVKPGPESPILYGDFNVGDFVRLRVLHSSVDIFTWVRVLEGAVEVFPDGTKRLASVSLELIVGGRPSESPERFFRRHLDEQRRRLEALERKVENLDTPTVAPPSSPSPDPGSGGSPPSEPTPPPPPPPPAPGQPATITAFSATGVHYIDGGQTVRGVQFSMTISSPGSPGAAAFGAGGNSTGDIAFGSGGGTLSPFVSTASGSQAYSASCANSFGGDSRSGSVNVPDTPAQ